MTDPSQLERRRQGARVVMRVPMEVRGITVDGNPLEESTHTGVAGEHGAMIRTSRMLKIGTEIEVANRFSQQTAKFRIAWAKEHQEGGPWELGIESLGPLNEFRGVRFPAKPQHG